MRRDFVWISALLVLAGCHAPEPGRQAQSNIGSAASAPAVPGTDSGPVAENSGAVHPPATTLGEYLAASHPDSIFVPRPGEDPRIGVDDWGKVRGIWCARTSLTLAVGTGWRILARGYFYPPSDTIAGLDGTSDPDSARSRYCRLGTVGLEVVGDSLPAMSLAALDSIAHSGKFGPFPGRFRSGVPRAINSSCFDLRLGFYDDAGRNALPCAGYIRDADTKSEVGPTVPPFKGRDSNDPSPSLRPDRQFLMAHLPPGARAFVDSLDDQVARLSGRLGDTLPADFELVRGLAHFRTFLPSGNAEQEAAGLIVMEELLNDAQSAGMFGRPSRENIQAVEAFAPVGLRPWYDENGEEWVVGGAWDSSAAALHPSGPLGDSVFAWVVGRLPECGDYGGNRFGAGIALTRPFTDPAQSSTTRQLAWYRLAQFWVDSARGMGVDRARSLIDSAVVALRAGLALGPADSMSIRARRAIQRAELGLWPLLPVGGCEYVD